MMDEKAKAKLKARVDKWTINWLKKWDGKCSICGKQVQNEDLWSNGMPDCINGAVVGHYIEIYGHRTCVQNVDNLVVTPNRIRILSA